MKSAEEAPFSHREIGTIIQQCCVRAEQKENGAYNKDVLNALRDLTGLANSELEEIALQVRHQREVGFFSIRQQAIIAGGFLLGLGVLLHFAARLLS